jgi:hypothetical protein
VKRNFSSNSWTGKYLTLDELQHFLTKVKQGGVPGSTVPNVRVSLTGKVKEIYTQLDDDAVQDYSE